MTHPRTTAPDGCSLDTARAQAMRSEADWIEMRDWANDLQKQRDALSDKFKAVTKWLEKNQPDVFRRGLWDAINASTSAKLSPTSPSVDHPDSSSCGESSAGTGRHSSTDAKKSESAQ